MKERVVVSIPRLLYAHKKVVILGIFTMAVGSVLSVAQPYVMKLLVDDAIGKGNLRLLVFCIAAVALIPFLQSILRSLDQFFLREAGEEIVDYLRCRLMEKLMRLSPGRILSSCSEVGLYIQYSLLSSWSNVLRLIGILVFMLYFNLKLATVAAFWWSPAGKSWRQGHMRS
jgi:ABC-type multidrug transport system fused ATPase/permease subunit